jgi:hypothetical protein
MNPMMLMMLPQLMGMMGGQGGAGGGAGGFDLGSLTGMGGLSMLGGHLGSKRAKKDKRSMLKRINKAVNSTEAIQGASLGNQEAMTRQATKQQLGGYDAARREADRMGRSSRQSALDRESQLGARASQGLASSGLGSTTMGANLQRGIASDTNRQLQGINEGLAGMFGDLALGRAGAEAAGSQALGGLAQQRGDIMSQLSQMRTLGGGQLGTMQAPITGGQSGFEMALPGMSQAFGQYMGSRNQGGMDPQMLQWLFGGKPGGYNPNAGAGMNLQTFGSGGG